MTTQTERELERGSIVRLWMITLAFIVLSLLFYVQLQIEKQENTQLKEQCNQDVRESVLYFKCANDTLQNVLMDNDNKSLYDYNIKEGCVLYKIK